MELNEISKKRFVFYSHDHEGTTGLDDELIAFFRDYTPQSIISIKFPFLESSDGAIRIHTIHSNNQSSHKKTWIRFYKPEVVSYVKDFIWGLLYGIIHFRKVDFFFGMNNLLSLIGIILKRLGLVQNVIYYIIDFTPLRYQNPLVNKIYYWIDTMVLYHSDLVVSLNQQMLDGRIHLSNLDPSRINAYIFPFGNTSSQWKEQDYQHDKRTLVYFGRVTKNKGSELLVPIMQELHKRGLPFQCKVIGGGDLDYLKAEITKYGLEKHFILTGRIEKQADIDKLLLHSGIAIAPYYPEDANNFSYFADPGKVKIYLGCGLPIVITQVPPIASSLVEEGAGIVAEYTAESFAVAIEQVFSEYEEYEKNAILFGKEFDWQTIFQNLVKALP